METTEVVSAVAIYNGRVLLTQRREGKDYALTWECPGGKVEGNESHHAALRREIREELGCELRAIGPTAIWCDWVTPKIFLLMYRVDLISTPHAQEKQGIGWFTADEMKGLGLTPGNAKALMAITHAMQTARLRTRCGMSLLGWAECNRTPGHMGECAVYAPENEPRP